MVTLRASKVERYAVRFEDRSTDPPVELSLDRIRLRAENVTTEKNRKGKISFSNTIGGEGNVSLAGVFSVDPPSLRAKVGWKALPIAPVQPYFTEKVKILVTGGAVAGEGDLSIEGKGGKTSVAYRGEASVNGFSSMDKARGEEFLRFATLHLGGVEAGYNPTKAIIDEIALSDFFSRIIVNPDATLNVQGIVLKGAAGQDNVSAKTGGAVSDVAAKPDAIPVRIETVTLQGGTILFSDRYVKPNYTANLVEIGGRVSGLSSEESRRADVDLRGKGRSTRWRRTCSSISRSISRRWTCRRSPLTRDGTRGTGSARGSLRSTSNTISRRKSWTPRTRCSSTSSPSAMRWTVRRRRSCPCGWRSRF